MRRHLQNRRTLRRASFALVALAVALIATVNNGALSAAQNSYHLVEGWPQIPASVPVSGMVSWVDVDSKGLLYLFRRCPIKCSDGPHPGSSDPPGATLLFDPSGRYLGEFEPKSGGKPKEAHAIRIDRHGFIWTTDVQLNVVRKYSSDGTLLMTLGKVGVAGETPELMNKPTDVLVAADDTIFVTDGYGNQRVVKFTKEGRFVKAWGKKGTAPGEFRIPHTIVQDRAGRIIVGDRCGLGETKCTDGRLQIFDTDGNYLMQWTPPGKDFWPTTIAVDTADRLYIDDMQQRKVWILEAKSGKVLETLDGVSGHGMAVSPSGDDIYITASGKHGVRRYSRPRSR